MKESPRLLELLAPARDADTAIAAIMAGADAVYIGPESHGARRAAANSIADIARVVEEAHPYGVKVYATVNTLIYDDEIASVEHLITGLYHAGVDALIVQDLSVMRMEIPPIDLHASTQCDIRTAEKARFLAAAGFSRLVLPRELSLNQIREMHDAVPSTSLEAFIHGALCVSYSGDCRASYMSGGRSANRGECAQICRLPFDLTDADGHSLIKGKHLLSLRDLNRSASIADMADAGVTSFKIEGRLKDPSYVRNTVAWYSRILDRLVQESGGLYARQSWGRSHPGFNPSPDKEFNRGFTSYFLTGKAPSRGVASIDTPKAIGSPVGEVTGSTPRFITARLNTPLSNGDGLGYFDSTGRFRGFRLNRVEGTRLFPASPQDIPRNTILYRNRDRQWDDMITSARTSRTIKTDMVLRTIRDSRVVLELSDSAGHSVTASAMAPTPMQKAVTPQEGPRRNILTKLGGTRYTAGKIADLAGDIFIPASLLSSLRRSAIELLERAARITYRYDYRLPEDPTALLPSPRLDIHDNVANRLARAFYESHGATSIIPAAEVKRPAGDVHVMTTRYCLRHEFGRCLRTPAGQKWPDGPMYLCNGHLKLRVEFDCRRCGMNIYLNNRDE